MVMNLNVKVSYAGPPLCDPCERVVRPPQGLDPQVENLLFLLLQSAPPRGLKVPYQARLDVSICHLILIFTR